MSEGGGGGGLDVLYAIHQLIITFVTYIFIILSLTLPFFNFKCACKILKEN